MCVRGGGMFWYVCVCVVSMCVVYVVCVWCVYVWCVLQAAKCFCDKPENKCQMTAMSFQLQPGDKQFLSFSPDSELLGGWQSFILHIPGAWHNAHRTLMNVCWVNINNPISTAVEDAHNHVCLPTSLP